MQKTLLTLCLISSGLPALPVQADEVHYRHIMFRESPYAAYRGIHPISEEVSQQVTHYEVEHDGQGRVVRVSRKYGDQVIPQHGTFDSFIWFAPEVRIAYDGNREIHTYYGLNGEQMKAHGDVWMAIYTLDDAGNRTSLEFLGNDGKPVASEWNVSRYEWRQSGDGHLFEKRFNLAGEQEKMRPVLEFYEVKLEYDEDGKLAFMRNFGKNHQPENNSSGAGIDRIVYDMAGNFVRWQVYDKDGNAVEGNRPMVHMGEHLYDGFGNKIGMRGFDRSGNRMAFSWGAIMEQTSYNKVGLPSGYIAHNPDGSMDIRLQYRYSADYSRQTLIQSLDEDGELLDSPMLRGAAEIRFGTDANGEPTREFFKADGSPLEASR